METLTKIKIELIFFGYVKKNDQNFWIIEEI